MLTNENTFSCQSSAWKYIPAYTATSNLLPLAECIRIDLNVFCSVLLLCLAIEPHGLLFLPERPPLVFTSVMMVVLLVLPFCALNKLTWYQLLFFFLQLWSIYSTTFNFSEMTQQYFRFTPFEQMVTRLYFHPWKQEEEKSADTRQKHSSKMKH